MLITLVFPLFPDSARTIVIDSANDLASYLSSQKEERYFELSGNVALQFSEKEGTSVHHIRADYLFFNREKSILTAKGNVEYILEQKGSSETFRGKSLVFNIDDLTGLFFDGESRKTQKADDKSIDFHYQGERIQRFEDGSVLLVKGLISSSKDPDPYYSIQAEQISILRPGEWAVKNAFLYMGRVPLIPLPFFFMPSDTFLFHPSFGMNEMKGYFVQSTSYIKGTSDEARSGGLSILQYLEDDTDQYTMVRDGLFLRREELPEGEKPEKGYLKILADYYHLLGAHVALEGEWEKSTLSTGIAFTREVYDLGTFGYSFLNPASGINSPVWQKPELFSFQFPFRFYLDLKSEIALGSYFSSTITLPLYSDPKVRSLFYPRKEGMQWKEFIDPDTVLDTGLNPSKNLVPELVLKTKKSIYLDRDNRISFSLPYLRLKGSLASRDSFGVDEFPLSWYYPEYLIGPDLSFSLNMKLFDTTKRDKKIQIPLDPPGSWQNDSFQQGDEREEGNEGSDPKSSGDGSFIPPPILSGDEQRKTEKPSSFFSNSLLLSIKPHITSRSIYNSAGVDTVDTVAYSPDYHIRHIKGSGSADYTADIANGLLIIKNSLTFNGSYQKHIRESEDLSDDYGKSSDLASRKYSISDQYTLQIYPFLGLSAWEKSGFTYGAQGKLLEGAYQLPDNETFSHIPLSWDKDSVQTHYLQGLISFDSGNISHQLNSKMFLPPLDERYEFSYTSKNNYLSLTMKESIYQENLQWLLDPFITELTVKPFSWLSFKEKLYLGMDSKSDDTFSSQLTLSFFKNTLNTSHHLMLSLEDYSLQEYSGKIKIFPFYADFLASREYNYTIGAGASGWEKVEDVYYFRPTKVKTGFLWEFAPDSFWKQRVDLNISLDTFWEMHLIRYTENRFAFELSLDLWIARFLDLELAVKSSNNRTYTYFPAFTNGQPASLLEDLLKSFNFSNPNDRLSSNFNLESISIKAIHAMDDWDLNVVYEGKPKLKHNDSGIPYYQWVPEFSIFLQWRPIPEIRKKVTYREEEMEW